MIYGVDISKWQGNINWAKLAQPAGHPKNHFCVIKAGYAGTTWGLWEDSKFRQNAAGAQGVFEGLGFYWFFVPRLSVSDSRKQAERFYELVNGKGWNFLAVDVEAQPRGYTVSPGTFSDYLKAFLDRLEDLAGVKAVIYSRASFWNPNTRSPRWAANYPLWIARYATHLVGPWSDGYFKPFPWASDGPDNWDFWQYSADKNGLGYTFGVESADIDRNKFDGNLSDFRKWLAEHGKYDPPAPPEPPDPDPDLTLEERVTDLEKRVDELEKEMSLL